MATQLDIALGEPILVVRPILQFNVLKSFAKNGVYFIDPETGDHIDGFLNLPSVGMTLTPPQEVKTETLNFGFHTLRTKTPKKPDPTTFELDGVLYFDYEDKEIATGYLAEKKAWLYYIKIWNDIEMRVWIDIIEKVVLELTEMTEGKPHPQVFFNVSSAFVPRLATEPSKLVLTKQQFRNFNSAKAAPIEVYSDDEDIEVGRRRSTPIF